MAISDLVCNPCVNSAHREIVLCCSPLPPPGTSMRVTSNTQHLLTREGINTCNKTNNNTQRLLTREGIFG
jgi:hypothetical protein